MKPRLLLLAITADRFADLAESDLASLLDQKNSDRLRKIIHLLGTDKSQYFTQPRPIIANYPCKDATRWVIS